MKSVFLSALATIAIIAVVALRWSSHDSPSNRPVPATIPGSFRSSGQRLAESRPPLEVDAASAALTRISIKEWQDPETRDRHLAYLRRWSANEPAACLEWVKSLPDDLAAILITEIAGGLMQSQPEEAVRFVEELPTGEMRDAMLKQAAMEYATSSLDQALKWAGDQPDAANRDLLLAAVYCVMSQSQPKQAAEKVLSDVGDLETRDRTLVEISQRWARQNIREAAVFVSQQEARVAIPAAVQLISQWPESDARACVEWISKLPEIGRNEVMSALVSRPTLHQRESLEALMNSTDDPLLLGIIRKQLDSP